MAGGSAHHRAAPPRPLLHPDSDDGVGPHAREALTYLAYLRVCVVLFFVFPFLRTPLEGLTIAGFAAVLLDLLTGISGALLLQGDPWCAGIVGPVLKRLPEPSALPAWAKVLSEDAFAFLIPLAALSAAGALQGTGHLLCLRPSHTSGFIGYLGPLLVVANTSLQIITLTFCWHLRGLIWRPHGGVTYAEVSRAASQVDHAEEAPGLHQAQRGSSSELAPALAPPVRPAARPPSTEETRSQTERDMALAIQRSLEDQARAQEDQSTSQAEATSSARAAEAATPDPNPAQEGESTASPEEPMEAEAEAEAEAAPAPEAETEEEMLELALRMPGGQRVKGMFPPSARVSSLYNFVEAESRNTGDAQVIDRSAYRLVSMHPRRVFNDKMQTLAEAGIEHQLLISVEVEK